MFMLRVILSPTIVIAVSAISHSVEPVELKRLLSRLMEKPGMIMVGDYNCAMNPSSYPLGGIGVIWGDFHALNLPRSTLRLPSASEFSHEMEHCSSEAKFILGISLRDCAVDSELLAMLMRVNSIRYLELRSVLVDNEAWKMIEGNRSLLQLELHEEESKLYELSVLQRFGQLTRLDLTTANLTSDDLKAVSRISTLKQLTIDLSWSSENSSYLTVEDFLPLAKMTSLQELWISKRLANRIDINAEKFFAEFTQLKHLRIGSNTIIPLDPSSGEAGVTSDDKTKPPAD